jgi:hypothetical protein
MPVVRHQTISENAHRPAGLALFHHAQKGFVVAAIIEDFATVVATVQDVEHHTTRGYACGSGHLIILIDVTEPVNNGTYPLFRVRTGKVTLWDSKMLSAEKRIQGSKTFTDPGRRSSALKQAEDAVKASGLSSADKAQALKSLKGGNVRYVTAGSGGAKNSVVRGGTP